MELNNATKLRTAMNYLRTRNIYILDRSNLLTYTPAYRSNIRHTIKEVRDRQTQFKR